MTDLRRAFYAHEGSAAADLVTILHVPYTVWHLSYVAVGASLAPGLDGVRLLGTLIAFAFGLGVGAHALDEVHDRPLATSLSDTSLWALGVGSMVVSAAVAVIGSFVISPWVLAWAGAGIALACAYSLEWSPLIHSDFGFAVAWGAFPLLVGYWAQSESLSVVALAGAGGATVVALLQRRLSRVARRLRRHPDPDLASGERDRRLVAVEAPLRILSATMPLIAVLLLILA